MGSSRLVVMLLSSVIIGDFNIKGISVTPYEADPPLIVDSYAALPFAPSLQLFQSIARRDAKVLKRNGAMKEQQFPPRRSFDRSKPGDVPVMEELLCFRRPERPDHGGIIAFNVKRYKTRLSSTSTAAGDGYEGSGGCMGSVVYCGISTSRSPTTSLEVVPTT